MDLRADIWRSRRVIIAAVVVIALLGVGLVAFMKTRPSDPDLAAASPAAYGTLHVVGNRLETSDSKTVRLYGVNRAGTEYACVQGWGVFSGTTDDASIQQLAAAHVHVVRLPLNEDCWLGINGDNGHTYMGAPYRTAVTDYVARLNAHGIYAILDLHWVAPGSNTAYSILGMPDADHAPAFWTSVAKTFANQSGVLFDLYNEPHDVDWACWKSGGMCGNATGYQNAGMQQLIDVVRGTGAHNVIMVEGLSWANEMSSMLAYWPNDPDHNLVASAHIYKPNTCHDVACWDEQMAPTAAKVPFIIGEFCACVPGEHGTLDTVFGDALLHWADAHGASYLAWTWDAQFGITSLLAQPDATQLTPYGQWMATHYATLDGAKQGAPPPKSSSTPVSLSGVPCTVEINGQPRSGTCTGSFIPTS